MASDPSGLMGLIAGGGPNPYLAQQQGLQGLQQDQQRTEAVGLQLQAARAEQAKQQQYQADVENYFKGGAKPEVLGSLILKYPQQAEAFKQSKSVLDQPQIDSQKTQYGELLNAADNNRADLATKKVQSIITAEKAAGHDISDAEDLLGQLQSSDPASQKAALRQLKGFAQLHLAGLDSKYADDLIKLANGGNHYTSTGDGAIYDQRTGDITRDAPQKPAQWDYDSKNERWIQKPGTGGGGQASGATGGSPGSTPNAPRRSMGWTPRARDGGDNSDAVVDSKIANISKATGLDPDAPLTPEQAAKVIAAIPATEGGAGSIADRNNNPGNIKFGGFARSQGAVKDPKSGYAVFPTREAGLRAAQRLGQGYYARGQRTIRDIIEGKPVGGSAAPAQGGGGAPGVINVPSASGGAAPNIVQGDISTVPAEMRGAVQAIADGRSAPPRPGTRNGEALLDAVTAYDPTFDAANAASRVKTRVDFTSGKSAQAVNALNTAMGHLLHLDDQAHDLGNFSTMPGILNPLYNTIREKVGNNTALPAFDQTKQAAASEMRKVFAGGGGGNLAELEAWEKQLSSSKSYEQLHEVIKNGVTLMGSRLGALQDQYATGMGRSDKIPQMIKPSIARAARQRFGVDFGAPSGPVQISGASDYAKLPSGTPYIDPQGHPRVKK